MLSAPPSGSFFFRFLSLPLLLGATLAGRAEAAPPASGSSSASGGAGAEAVDPWDGRGAPPSEAKPGAADSTAPPPEPVPEPPAEEAPVDPRTAYHKGNAAFREGRFTAARHYYRIALEGDHSFDVLCNLGRAEAELKDNVPAYVHLTLCLEEYPKDPELSSSRAAFASLREDVQDRLTAEQNERAEAMLVEARNPKPAPAPVAATATTPAPQAAAPEVDLGPRSPGLRMAVTLGLGSLALVGVGGGIGFYVHSTALGQQADTLREDLQQDGGDQACLAGPAACDELESKLAQSDQAQHIALGSFIAAGALGTAAVLTYVLWPHEYGPQESATRPSVPGRLAIGHLRPSAAFDPARGSMWLGLRGTF